MDSASRDCRARQCGSVLNSGARHRQRIVPATGLASVVAKATNLVLLELQLQRHLARLLELGDIVLMLVK